MVCAILFAQDFVMCDGCSWFVSQYSAWQGIVYSEEKIDGKNEIDVSTVTVTELAVLFLKSNIFNFNEKHLNKKEAQQLRQRDFVETLKEIHPKIKSSEANKLFDVSVSLIDDQIETDFYVKLADSDQYLNSSSCHP